MPYRYLEDIAIADVAFEARGETIEEMFASAADALANVMVEDLSTIHSAETVEVSVEHPETDLLLFDFLSELVFFKDARLLLLRVCTIVVERRDPICRVKAVLYGERIDETRHHMKVDVKAVTVHRLSVQQTREGGWVGTVVLDV